MTQVIEELIDGLSLESLGDSVPTRESNSSHTHPSDWVVGWIAISAKFRLYQLFDWKDNGEGCTLPNGAIDGDFAGV